MWVRPRPLVLSARRLPESGASAVRMRVFGRPRKSRVETVARFPDVLSVSDAGLAAGRALGDVTRVV